MPFTPSHMAAVLPFLRLPLAPAALAVGAMAPDVPYYLPVPVTPAHAHSAPGVVGADVAMGAAALLVWHVLLARPALAVSPRFLRLRALPDALAPLRDRGWLIGSVVIYASLAVGTATHVFWDSFTHSGRWGVRQVPWLAEMHGALPGYRWAQYASGIFGAVVLSLWLVSWCRRTPGRAEDADAPAEPHRFLGWLAIAATGLVAAAIAAWEPLTRDGGAEVRSALFLAATRGAAASFLAAVALAACWHAVQWRRPVASPQQRSDGPDQ